MTVNSAVLSNYNPLSAQSQSSVESSSSFSAIMQQLADQLLKSVDTNKDGSIDKTEFSAAAQQLSQNPLTANTDTSAANLDKVFSSLDANSDGNINSSELLSALQNSAQQAPQTGGLHHHHHAAKSGASSMASQDPSASANSTTAQSSTQSTNALQSILMNKILSAYNTTHSQSSGSKISLAV